MVIVADGTPEAARRLERVLRNDPGPASCGTPMRATRLRWPARTSRDSTCRCSCSVERAVAGVGAGAPDRAPLMERKATWPELQTSRAACRASGPTPWSPRSWPWRCYCCSGRSTPSCGTCGRRPPPRPAEPGEFCTGLRDCPRPDAADTAGIGRSGGTRLLARTLLRSSPGQSNGTLPMTSERRRHRDPAPGTRAMDIPRGSRGQG